MAYAVGTTIPVEKSITEIIALVKRAGAERIAQYEEPAGFQIQFGLADRLIRFRVSLPQIGDVPAVRGDGRHRTTAEMVTKRDALQRQRARALLLVIKAKLESVESGVETFEQAFLPNVVMTDGATVYDRVAAPIALEYQTSQPSALLLAGPHEPTGRDPR
jgi:hypothetical protein